jgi:hypothetical protein
MLVDRDEIRDLSNFEVNNTFVILTPSDSNISPPFVQVMKMSSTNAPMQKKIGSAIKQFDDQYIMLIFFLIFNPPSPNFRYLFNLTSEL